MHVMHLGGARLAGHRRMPSWQKRLSRVHIPPLVPVTLLILLSAALCTILALVARLRARDDGNGQGARLVGRDAQCSRVKIGNMLAFDDHMLEEKGRGRLVTQFENRFQETVWDTLVLRPGDSKIPALFPAWSDKMWYLGEYGRGLAEDLKSLVAIAARATGSYAPVLRYVHKRLDRIRGLQYAAAVDTGSGTEVLVSMRRAIDGPACMMQMRSVAQKERVHVLLPYSQRAERIRLFLENIKFLRERHALDIVVIVCILQGMEDDIAEVQRLRKDLFGNGEDPVSVSHNSGDANGNFSRGVALREAAKTLPEDAVLFMCDVDMIVLPGFVERCGRNSILGSQVFYPVFYSLFPYANERPVIEQRNGFWRFTSFGMVCIRNGDFRDVDPFGGAEERFQGWGSEDVFMFEKIRNTSNLVAFRSVEPGLRHRWHSKRCNKESKAYLDCMKTNFATMGHPLRIGPALLSAFENAEELYDRVQKA